MFLIRAYHFLCFFCFFPTFGLKTWIPTTNTNDQRNWNIGEVPRDCDDVSFNVDSDIPLLWSAKESLLSGLKLPKSGILAFENDMSIVFRQRNLCPTFRELEYRRNEWKGWLDPENWESDSATSWLPHSERVPCFGEDVKFPFGRNFAITLPPILVPIGKIIFGDEEYSGDEWAAYLNSDEGRSQFVSQETEQLPWSNDGQCPGRRKCSCSTSAYALRNRVYKSVPPSVLHEAICLYGKRTCQKLDCYSPVVPEGHCCGICGAVIKIGDDSEDDGRLHALRERVTKMKAEMDDDDELIKYHVGRTMDGNIEIVILSETSDQMNDALTFAALVRENMVGDEMGKILASKFSGLTLSSYFSRGIVGIIFGTFFSVLFFFVSIYYIYIILPKKRIAGLTEQNRFRFARFKNLLPESGSNENLEIGEEAAVEEPVQGFHNPTFSADPGPATPQSDTDEGVVKESEIKVSQEYSNPIYHEMEKSRGMEYFEGESGEGENEKENDRKFSDVKLD